MAKKSERKKREGKKDNTNQFESVDVVIINRTDSGSTGDIAYSQLMFFRERGISTDLLVLDKNKPLSTKIKSSKFLQQVNRVLTKISGKDGFYNFSNTRTIIEFLKKTRPKAVFLHNLHGYYINFPRLITFLSNEGIPTVWTLHDCWAFTGKCPHFVAAQCDKWRHGCGRCPINRLYPKAYFFDRTKQMLSEKKNILLAANNITYVLISHFMKECFDRSFLSNKPSELIFDGVDVSYYISCEKHDVKSEFDPSRKKKMYLFVAASWNISKGLNLIAKLKEAIAKREAFIAVAGLPSDHPLHDGHSCFCLGKVDHERLADLYFSADVYINASLEESFGMTIVEAMACGTPVVSYDSGAAKSIITPQVGEVVPAGDAERLIRLALSISKNKYDSGKLLFQSQKFSFESMNAQYSNLFFKVENL